MFFLVESVIVVVAKNLLKVEKNTREKLRIHLEVHLSLLFVSILNLSKCLFYLCKVILREQTLNLLFRFKVFIPFNIPRLQTDLTRSLGV